MGHPYRDPPEDMVPRPIVYQMKVQIFLEGNYGANNKGPPKEHVLDRMREELEAWRASADPVIDKREILAIHVDPLANVVEEDTHP
jgi:hypothetical protein